MHAIFMNISYNTKMNILKHLSIWLTIFCFTIPSLLAQDQKRCPIWVSPSTATDVYGIMLNFWPNEFTSSYPNIYGMELNLNPIGIFVPFVLLIHSLNSESHNFIDTNIDSIDFSVYKKIYGMQIGTINLEPSFIYGLDINISGSFHSKVNGLTLSLIMNKHDIINGLTFAMMGNHDVQCRGIQIGLINSSKNLKGLQFGLWNKNQKRSLPIINWCFKK